MITGSIVALVTPMRSDGQLDWKSLDALVDFHLDEGTSGIVAVGTTGESATLSVGEHCEVIGRVVERVSGRIPVIAGTGANATSEAIELTEQAKKAGADAALLVTPYYNKPTQEGLYRHYMVVADEVDIPQILYNVPGRTAVDMLSETVARLTGHDNIVGIKEATGSTERLQELKALCPDDFALYSGDDATAMEFMLQGGHGVISVTANVRPGLMEAMSRSAIAGEREVAEATNRRLELLHDRLFLEANPIPVKWLLANMGMIPDGIRLPLTPLSSIYHSELIEALAQ